MTLELSNVSITLGGRQLVKGLDLKLAPGDVVGLLGPKGAGKTTTFNLVIGLLSPDQGEVTVNGERVTHLPMPCLLYTSPSPRDVEESRMPSSA